MSAKNKHALKKIIDICSFLECKVPKQRQKSRSDPAFPFSLGVCVCVLADADADAVMKCAVIGWSSRDLIRLFN